MKKTTRIGIAKDTLDILENGYYTNSQGKRITIGEEMQFSLSKSIHYTPESFTVVLTNADSIISEKKEITTAYEIVNASSLEAAFALTKQGSANLLCLNFASAKNPGGGFLNGSQAQEESLARSSGLYPCLIKNMAMYTANRSYQSCLYTDHMIYSPKVPVFKDDDGNLLDAPYLLSFITSPAVNAGVVRRNEPENISNIESTMIKRIEKVLSVALVNGHSSLILGAWGCGVFQNDPAQVASYFAYHLKKGKFKDVFERLVFAVLSKDEGFITPFKELFLKP